MGKVANGINTVHLSYVREWIPAAHLDDPAKSLAMGPPEDLVFRTKGQLAVDILAEAFADGVLFTAIARHTVLVMAALATCAVTAALLRRRTGTQPPAPAHPDQPPPADPGMIPLTVPETGRLLAHPPPPGSAGHWLDWRRRHQALSAWYHQRNRLSRNVTIAQVS